MPRHNVHSRAHVHVYTAWPMPQVMHEQQPSLLRHNYICHNYICHNYMGHNYMGHNSICHR